VRWYGRLQGERSPLAAATAIAAFTPWSSIAGGRNKGLDLSPLAAEAGRVRHVVAIGEAADDVTRAFTGPGSGPGSPAVTRAASMDEAVLVAAEAARPGDAVLLSPGCASFDWYGGYGERGDDFARAVAEHAGRTS
jgi:UDP-N-acetylmuramoylalanine--D-glutamate ligase